MEFEKIKKCFDKNRVYKIKEIYEILDSLEIPKKNIFSENFSIIVKDYYKDRSFAINYRYANNLSNEEVIILSISSIWKELPICDVNDDHN